MEETIKSVETIVTHIQENQRYKVQFERGATKGVIGYKVEANGDVLLETMGDAIRLRKEAIIEVGADPTV